MRNIIFILGSIIPGGIVAVSIVKILHVTNNLEAMLIGCVTGICVTSIVLMLVKRYF